MWDLENEPTSLQHVSLVSMQPGNMALNGFQQLHVLLSEAGLDEERTLVALSRVSTDLHAWCISATAEQLERQVKIIGEVMPPLLLQQCEDDNYLNVVAQALINAFLSEPGEHHRRTLLVQLKRELREDGTFYVDGMHVSAFVEVLQKKIEVMEERITQLEERMASHNLSLNIAIGRHDQLQLDVTALSQRVDQFIGSNSNTADLFEAALRSQYEMMKEELAKRDTTIENLRKQLANLY